MGAQQWIDVTRPMDQSLVCWPGRTPPKIDWTRRLDRGDHCNVSAWELSAHTGTHIDAPLHFVAGGASIDQISPDVFVGSCHVVTNGRFDVEQLAGAQRVLIKTGYSDLQRFQPHPSLMSIDAARTLLAGGLRVVGTDRLSVDDTQTRTFALHHALLSNGCIIIEGLDLSSIADGQYEMIALPLRMTGAEASPARVLLRPRA